MNNSKFLPTAVILIVVVVVGYFLLNTPDRRDPVQKVGDAIQELPNGPDKAARQLESRTPAQKLEDSAKDEKNDVKKALNQQ